jgi:probable phosphoglycerate mutase
MASKLIFLARHGETDWNAQGRWQGHTDIPLNDRGREQARAVAATLRDSGLGGLASSDLSRAYETARIVGHELGLKVDYVDAGLRERSLGPFEGLTRAECEERHAEAWRAWIEEQKPPANGEDADTVAARILAAIGRAAERLARHGAPALLVTHGGALRQAVRAATGSLPGPVANCSIWRFEWAGRVVHAEQVILG